MFLQQLLASASSTAQDDLLPNRLAVGAEDVTHTQLGTEDIPSALELAKRSVAPIPLPWVISTLEFHSHCLRHGVDDGRRFFLQRHGEHVAGLCGYHRYLWGPPNACWASWFILDPKCHENRVSPWSVAFQDGTTRGLPENVRGDL